MSEPKSQNAAALTSLDVRQRLVEAIELDLIGPAAGDELAEESLPAYEAPSNWYLTGFLIPSGTPPEAIAEHDEQEDRGPDETPGRPGLSEETTEDRMAAKKLFFPSSMGLSFLAAAEGRLEVTIRWGDYELAGSGFEAAEAANSTGDGAHEDGERRWQRRARQETVRVTLGAAESSEHEVPGSNGLRLQVEQRPVVGVSSIPESTQAVSLFLVNNRAPATALQDAEATYVFQAGLEVRGERPFVPRPDPRSPDGEDWDEQIAALHYLDTPSYATGHNVSVTWDLAADGSCHALRTTWLPQAEVEKTETFEPDGVDLSMDRLGELVDAADAEVTLRPLVGAYQEWIDVRRLGLADLPAPHSETAAELLD